MFETEEHNIPLGGNDKIIMLKLPNILIFKFSNILIFHYKSFKTLEKWKMISDLHTLDLKNT